MAYETKVMLIALSKIIGKADSIEEIYRAVQEMAQADGLDLQSLDDLRKEIEEMKNRQGV